MTRRFKIVLFLIIPVLIITSGVILYLLAGRTAETEVSAEDVQLSIVEVEVLTKRDGIEISGNIEPVASADLAFPIAGYIEKILVSAGDKVSSGETVAILEDSQQRFNLAEVDVEIDTELVSGTQRNLELLDLKRQMKATELEDTRLKSTISGVVTEVYADTGDFVTAQQAGSASDVIVRVIDRSSMMALVEVDELDAPYLSPGQRVEFQFDAYPDLSVSGKVSMIPMEARVTSQGIAVLDTEVVIENPPSEILPFFTFSGEIFLEADEAILLIPVDAVMTRGERTLAFVVVSAEEADAAKAERSAGGGGGSGGGGAPGGGALADIVLPEGIGVLPTPVTVSDFSSTQVQVLSGLKAGEQILVLPPAGGAEAVSEKDSGGTNVLELLGLPSGPGGRPPGGGGSGGSGSGSR